MEPYTEELVVLYLYTKRRKRKRRVSVHERLQRHEFGEFHYLVQELQFHRTNSINTLECHRSILTTFCS